MSYPPPPPPSPPAHAHPTPSSPYISYHPRDPHPYYSNARSRSDSYDSRRDAHRYSHHSYPSPLSDSHRRYDRSDDSVHDSRGNRSRRRSRSRSPRRRYDTSSSSPPRSPPYESRYPSAAPIPPSIVPRSLQPGPLPLPPYHHRPPPHFSPFIPPPPPIPLPCDPPLIRLSLPSSSPSRPFPPPPTAPRFPLSHSSPTSPYLLPSDVSTPSSNPHYAYVWLVMKGDSYIPGALTSAYSVSLTSTPHTLVCMVTPDVTTAGRHRLGLLFHSVVEVPYITAHAKPLRTNKQQQLYAKWVEQSFTKWNCLSLPYDKVLFVDADKIILSNIDHLFCLPTPAATFSSPWASTYVAPSRKRGAGLLNPYAALKHGDRVPHAAIEGGLHTNSFVLIGTMVLLRPSTEGYQKYLDMLEPYQEEVGEGQVQPLFGYDTCHSMMDEQSLCLFYHSVIQQQFTYIHQRYNFISWHRSWLSAEDMPYVFHYFSTKPWVLKRNEYVDLEVWWTVAGAMVGDDGRWGEEERKELREAFDEGQLQGERLEGCAWCKEDGAEDWQGHPLLDTQGKMRCPRLLTRKMEDGAEALLTPPVVAEVPG